MTLCMFCEICHTSLAGDIAVAAHTCHFWPYDNGQCQDSSRQVNRLWINKMSLVRV